MINQYDIEDMKDYKQPEAQEEPKESILDEILGIFPAYQEFKINISNDYEQGSFNTYE